MWQAMLKRHHTWSCDVVWKSLERGVRVREKVRERERDRNNP